MRPRSRRRNLVVWSSSAAPAGGPASLGTVRRRRGGRIRLRRGLHIGALLTVLGLMRLARLARTRWEPVCLLAGAVLLVVGFELPEAGAFLAGMLVVFVTLLGWQRGDALRNSPAAGQDLDVSNEGDPPRPGKCPA